MPKLEKAVAGAPCWVDLTSVKFEDSKPFYQAVFGWDFADMGPEFGGYNIISRDGADLGGAIQYNADFMGPTEINFWTVYFATQSVDSSLTSITEHGGKLYMPAMPVAEQGISSEATDPSGATFGLWQPNQREGFERYGEHGFPGWFELHTRNFDTDSAFYSTVLGADLGRTEMSEGMQYHTLDIDGDQKAGIFGIVGVMPDDAPTGWVIYFTVDDADVAVAAVRENGGTVLSGPEDTPYGRIAQVLDPSGVALSIMGVMAG